MSKPHNNLPFIAVRENRVIGLVTTDRKPMFENDMCRSAGLMATCNDCDRIIFEDENALEAYKKSGGYCTECITDQS